MRLRRFRLGLLLAVLVGLAACEINPQPPLPAKDSGMAPGPGAGGAVSSGDGTAGTSAPIVGGGTSASGGSLAIDLGGNSSGEGGAASPTTPDDGGAGGATDAGGAGGEGGAAVGVGPK